mgnify:CR=1 FL=1
MNSRIVWLSVCMVWGIFSSCNTDRERKIDYTRYVNPFVGNADNGHTFPGACAPFGLIQVSPESGNGSWRYCSGFNYDDDSIAGFSQTHLNGTGVPDLGDIRMLPFNQNLQGERFFCRYERETQVAMPGYYSVKLADMNIDVELTVTERTAMHKYTFNQPGEANLLLDLQNGLVFNSKNIRYRVLEGEVEMLDNKTIAGYNRVRGWVARYFYYMIVFDRPYTVKKELPQEEGEKAKRFILEFDLKEGESVQVKVALSTVGIEGAKMALDKENPGWNFESIKAETNGKWNDMLSLVEVEGTEEEKMNFYTSMYHLFIQPTNIADIDGKYRGANDSIFVSSTGYYYSTFSLWDTYRAAHPLYTLLVPERAGDMVESMIAHKEAKGFLPIWTLWGKENYCMIGNHAVPVIVDAYLKGLITSDPERAYAAIKESLTLSQLNSDWEVYDKYGYYPFDIIEKESVSRTLESAYDDYCAALMAQALGKEEDYRFFMKRAGYYQNLFDKQTGMMRGKDSTGSWRVPFNMFSLSHASSHGGDYTEGNAWQYTWHVQHDVPGLIQLFGGEEPFLNKLDSLFTVKLEGESLSDVTGLIGQYAHGNEPGHHTIYMYNRVGRPDKTQKYVNQVLTTLYDNTPAGICGNEDTGQMSAWYVFSSLGFYPMNPASGQYELGAPLFRKAVIRLASGKKLVIRADNLSDENIYVDKVYLNGQLLDRTYITFEEVQQGGELRFEMKGDDL